MAGMYVKVHSLLIEKEPGVMGKGTISIYVPTQKHPIATFYSSQWQEFYAMVAKVNDIVQKGLASGDMSLVRAVTNTPSASGRIDLAAYTIPKK